jgi:hypothetical protein
MPRAKAFCRSEPSDRFIAFAIFFTGVLAFEWARSSRTSAFVYSTRVRFFTDFFVAFLAISTPVLVDFIRKQKCVTIAYRNRPQQLALVFKKFFMPPKAEETSAPNLFRSFSARH